MMRRRTSHKIKAAEHFFLIYLIKCLYLRHLRIYVDDRKNLLLLLSSHYFEDPASVCKTQLAKKVSDLHMFNLFMTSKNETTNSPIYELKVLYEGQRAF